MKYRTKALSEGADSCRLPLAIATLVGVVHSRVEDGQDMESALFKIEENACRNVSKFTGEDLDDRIDRAGLFAAMGESLAFLGENSSDRVVPLALAQRKYEDGEDARLFALTMTISRSTLSALDTLR